MSAHNYDGDMLTDEVAQVHRSPGFITSNLVGQDDNGNLIKEFEASHGTVTNQWNAHLKGIETSFNPLGMAEALMGALTHDQVFVKMKNSHNTPKNLLKNFVQVCIVRFNLDMEQKI